MARELPPPAQMVLLLGGFRVSQALYAAAALGVADHLVAGPESAEVLSQPAGIHPDLAQRNRVYLVTAVLPTPRLGRVSWWL